jgi:sugar/nucleoside kinase (ribokinase family)
MVLAALGDLLLDVIVRLEEPLAPGSDVRARISAGPGGQAANVAAWAAELGADEARLVTALGDDVAAGLVRNDLVERGVRVCAYTYAYATGVVTAMVGPDGERSLASDRGVSVELRAEDLDPAWFDGLDVLHVSGYALVREPIRDAALLAVRLARDRGACVSVDLAPWTELRTFGPVAFRELLDTLVPDVLFATEAEWQILGGSYLAAPTTVLKRGPRGITVATADARLDLSPVAGEVVDATGAGDALAAGFLLGGSLEEAARRGLDAAARCVARPGAMP